MRRPPARVLAGLVVALTAATSCTGGSDAGPSAGFYAVDDLECGQDRSSDDAESVVERVGGLRTDDFVVRLAQSTRAGVVALVDGDVEVAFGELSEDYGVALVGSYGDGGDGGAKADGLARIEDFVSVACG